MRHPSHSRLFRAEAARVAAALALALAPVGCGAPFAAATPPGFVELEDRYEDDEYRAATADGVVLGVRALDNEPRGEISFWTRLIQNRMRDVGGYALLETRAVKARNGQDGKQLRFGHDEGKEPHLYIVSLFVTDDTVFLLEAGGSKEQMTREMAQIDWSVRNFLPR